jgi:hypothetical protein
MREKCFLYLIFQFLRQLHFKKRTTFKNSMFSFAWRSYPDLYFLCKNSAKTINTTRYKKISTKLNCYHLLRKWTDNPSVCNDGPVSVGQPQHLNRLFGNLYRPLQYSNHRFNTELDLQSVYLGSMCTVVLIFWLKPSTPPPPPGIWTHIRVRYWSAKIDDISLWPPDSNIDIGPHRYLGGGGGGGGPPLMGQF